MICIAYNHKNEIISIVNAKNTGLATAFWHGAGVLPHSIKTELDFNPEINGTGVVPILQTKEIFVHHLKSDTKIVVQK